jgi:hypothetical protein
MSPEEIWKEMCCDTLERMKEHVESFITPIWKYKEVNEKDIELHGSGSYFENSNGKFIITNQHVAKYNQNFRLTHSFKGSTNILNIRKPFISKLPPVDVAISKIENDTWLKNCCEGQAIPINRFSNKHSPVEGELLFLAGFSGERSRVLFDNCFSRGTPFLTQECPLPDSVAQADQTYHISIPYPPELAETRNPSEPLPNPHGFSGSLLWNTKRKECQKKEIEWTPSLAEVTGIIWGWPSSAACILATKIEHINLEEMTQEYKKI